MRKVSASPTSGKSNTFVKRTFRDDPANSIFQATLASSGLERSFRKDSATPTDPRHKGSLSPNVMRRSRKEVGSLTLKFDELQAEYDTLVVSNQRLVEENTTMQRGRSSNILSNGSESTIRLGETEQLRQSLAEECEELEEVLSAAHQSISDLLEEYGRLSSEYEGIYREYHRVKYIAEMEDSTRDVKLSLLRETLDKKTDEYKLLTREIKKIEGAIHEAKNQQDSLNREIAAIDEQVMQLEAEADPELVTAAELCKQIALLSSMLSYSQEKVLRYEKYFQSAKPN